MADPRPLAGLRSIANQYDGLLCDAWGVIHNGHRLYDGVAEALLAFKAQRGPVIILTNAPRLNDVIPAQLDALGLPRDAYDAIVTSGDATRAALAARVDQPVYRLGPDKDETLFNALPVTFVDMADAKLMLCTGLLDDLNETPEDYRDLLTKAVDQGLPMLCANPDRVAKLGDRLIYCAGALGDLYEELGGEVILCGKPHPPIYAEARRQITAAGLKPGGRLLAIGDGVQTDILGANNEEIDVVFVAEGIFSEQARGPDGRLSPAKLSALLSSHSVHAEFAMEGLVW